MVLTNPSSVLLLSLYFFSMLKIWYLGQNIISNIKKKKKYPIYKQKLNDSHSRYYTSINLSLIYFYKCSRYFSKVNLRVIFTEMIQSMNTQTLNHYGINEAYYFKHVGTTGNKKMVILQECYIFECVSI